MDKIEIIPNRKYTTKSIRTKDGVIHQVYSLGALANAIERHPHTIRQWEVNGVVPKPILSGSLSSNQRFYLKEEIRAYIYCIGMTKFDRGVSAEASGFKKLIRQQLSAVEKSFFDAVDKNLEVQKTREAKDPKKSEVRTRRKTR